MRKDISEEIELKNGRKRDHYLHSEIHHEGKMIGSLENGEPVNFIEGYSFRVTKEGETKRVTIFQDQVDAKT